ncbi:MAG: hypothetical protein ACTHM8_05365 [Sphingomonas sp.]
MIAVSIMAILAAAHPGGASGDARVTLSKFMRCVMNRHEYKILPLLERPVGALREPNWAALADDDCLEVSGSLKFAPMLMRGEIYNILYRKEFGGTQPVTSFAGAPQINYPFADPVPSDSKDANTYKLEMALGDCTARAQPEEARSLVMSDVESSEEQSAVQALVPAISACLPKGQTLNMNKSTIRAFVAESLYRLTVAKRNLSHAQG